MTISPSARDRFPFHALIVTNPDLAAASACLSGPLLSVSSSLPPGPDGRDVEVLACCDPHGARVGSGGGTLSALERADAVIREKEERRREGRDEGGDAGEEREKKRSVLIIHAGGESSRCPTQMVLGKAWTSLPVLLGYGAPPPPPSSSQNGVSCADPSDNDDGAASPPPEKAEVITPTSLLVSELSTLFRDLPSGSVVVCAGDVLLGLPPGKKVRFTSSSEGEGGGGGGGVMGLAVPSPLETARNHGVFVLGSASSPAEEDDGKEEELALRPVSSFLQKPPPPVMRSSKCTFSATHHSGEESAWIDTGVVAFLPEAADALRGLSERELRGCTEGGLMELWREERKEEGSSSEGGGGEKADPGGFGVFVQSHAIKVDLYTHLMMALSSPTLESYLNLHLDDSGGMIVPSTLTAIYNALSPHSFQAVAIPTGTFVHLGTTRELLDFLTMEGSIGRGGPLRALHARKSSDDAVAAGEEVPDGKCSKSRARLELGRKIGMTERAAVALGQGVKTEEGIVLLNSSVSVKEGTLENGDKLEDDSVIGRWSVLEHVDLLAPSGASIGRGCLISGLRGLSCRKVVVPDGMCLQMLPLKRDWDAGKAGNVAAAGREVEVRARALAMARARDDEHAVQEESMGGGEAVEGPATTAEWSRQTECSSVHATDGDLGERDTYVDAAAEQASREAEMRASALERARAREARLAKEGNDVIASPAPQDRPSEFCSIISVAATNGEDLTALVADLDIVDDIEHEVLEESSSAAAVEGGPHVLLYLGVDDPIKKAPCTKLYGLPLDEVLCKKTGLRDVDIWGDDVSEDSKKTLWNAKIHPVVHPLNIAQSPTAGTGLCAKTELDLSPVEWIASLFKERTDRGIDGEERSAAFRSSLELWRALPRLSLREIRDAANAASEFAYRIELESCIGKGISFRGGTTIFRDQRLEDAVRILKERKHEPCNLDFVLTAVSQMPQRAKNVLSGALAALDEVVIESITRGRYDVAGRALMVEAGLLSEVASLQKCNDDSIERKASHEEVEIGGVGLTFRSHLEALRSKKSCTDRNRAEKCHAILRLRDASILSHPSSFGKIMGRWVDWLEASASAMTELCVGGAEVDIDTSFEGRKVERPPVGTWAVASAPARIDLSGGWSDTPPVSYEFGGAVACLAVAVDGRKPLSCRCRIVPSSASSPPILVRTEGRSPRDGTLVGEPAEIPLCNVSDLADFRHPHAKGALVKCSLIFLGVVPVDHPALLLHSRNSSLAEIGVNGGGNVDESLQGFVNQFCGRAAGCSPEGNVSLEVVSVSLLPLGSGMGTSSILGGCVLASVGRCGGIDLVMTPDSRNQERQDGSDDRLIHAVLAVEQLLTTGGGWQDQVGGLVGGLKVGRSSAGSIPLHTTVERIPLNPRAREALDTRMTLAFTGQPRLARNILRNVLRMWAGRSPEIVETVSGLVRGAVEAADSLRNRGGDAEENLVDPLGNLGAVMHQYWEYKRAMAGKNSRAEPEAVREVLSFLYDKGIICGGTLCGAGGGGFLAMLASQGKTSVDVRKEVEEGLSKGETEVFTWHKCRVCEEGLSVKYVETRKGSGPCDAFDISWHNVTD